MSSKLVGRVAWHQLPGNQFEGMKSQQMVKRRWSVRRSQQRLWHRACPSSHLPSPVDHHPRYAVGNKLVTWRSISTFYLPGDVVQFRGFPLLQHYANSKGGLPDS